MLSGQEAEDSIHHRLAAPSFSLFQHFNIKQLQSYRKAAGSGQRASVPPPAGDYSPKVPGASFREKVPVQYHTSQPALLPLQSLSICLCSHFPSKAAPQSFCDFQDYVFSEAQRPVIS